MTSVNPMRIGANWSGRDAENGEGLSLVRILRAFRRRKFLIASIVGLSSVATYAAVSHLPPRYTAEAVIMIEPRKGQALDVKSGVPQVALDASTIRTETEVLRSFDLADRVAAKLNLVHEKEFAAKPNRLTLLYQSILATLPEPARNAMNALSWTKGGAKDGAGGDGARKAPESPLPSQQDVVERLLDNLSVSNDGRSAIIKVRYETADPKLGATIANTFASAYIEDQLMAKSAAIIRAGVLLNQRVDELRETVLVSDAAVQTFRDENRLTEARGMTVTGQQLAETNTQLTLAATERSQKEANLAQLVAMIQTGQGPDAAIQIMNSPTIIALKGQLTQVLQREAELVTKFDTAHPAVRDVQNQETELRSQIDKEMSDIVAGLTSDVESERTREAFLKSRLDELENRAHELDKAQVHLHQLEREANANHELYEHFLTRAKETSVQKYFEEPDARVVSSALVPKSPTFPQTARIVELAAIASLIGALSLAMLIERFDHTFLNADELESEAELLSFGMIPEVARGRGNPKLVLEHPTSAFSEAIRWVRTSLDLSVANRAKVVMITSSTSREGKTTLSSSLARSAAHSGQRVLLIDCDLRLGKIANVFGASGTGSLEAFIRGEADTSAIIRTDEASGLDYIPAALGAPNPQALLGSVQMGSLLQRMRQSYDLIILDSPPVLAVSDALIVAKLADATILVVRWNVTLRSGAFKALRELRKVGANVVGFVLTRVDVRKNRLNGYVGSDYQYVDVAASAQPAAPARVTERG
jgi:succinoglycan biosynthesis transport protein ExoP